MDPIISVKHLSVTFRDIPALWNVSFDIPKGSLVAIVGPNGAGKSTLLKTMLGIVNANHGLIEIMGDKHKELKDKYKKIAYVPQRSSVDWDFPINCLDVVIMGRYGHLGWLRKPGKKEKDMAMDALRKFGMEDYYDRQIGELSGGQKQRIFLARAHIQNADIFFFDEPFGGVDATTEKITLDLLKELSDQGKTILVVTHDLQSLKGYFDYVLLLNTQKIAFGTPDEVLSPDKLLSAYGGSMHIISHANGSSQEESEK